MKILQINDRGISLIENSEVINRAIFSNVEEIPNEIYELLSIFDYPEKIQLDISIDLTENIISEIHKTLKNSGWEIYKKKSNHKLNLILIGFIFLEVILGSILWLKNISLNSKVIELRKNNSKIKKTIDAENKTLNEIPKLDNQSFDFQKSNIHDFLLFLYSVFSTLNLKVEKIEYSDDKIIVNGYGDNVHDVFSLKSYLHDNEYVVTSKFDFIENKGGFLFFLIELTKQ